MLGHEVFYATDIIAVADIRTRQPHPVQSQAAAALAARLIDAIGPTAMISKSHSRALVAVAWAMPPVTALGVDIEWMEPDRRFSAILSAFLPAAPDGVDRDTFYRAWTFLEAHFKAYQRWPDEAEIRQVLAAPAGDDVWQTAAGNQLLQRRICDDFQLTVLWRSDGAATAGSWR